MEQNWFLFSVFWFVPWVTSPSGRFLFSTNIIRVNPSGCISLENVFNFKIIIKHLGEVLSSIKDEKNL